MILNVTVLTGMIKEEKMGVRKKEKEFFTVPSNLPSGVLSLTLTFLAWGLSWPPELYFTNQARLTSHPAPQKAAPRGPYSPELWLLAEVERSGESKESAGDQSICFFYSSGSFPARWLWINCVSLDGWLSPPWVPATDPLFLWPRHGNDLCATDPPCSTPLWVFFWIPENSTLKTAIWKNKTKRK